jgi:hypothetical protein
VGCLALLCIVALFPLVAEASYPFTWTVVGDWGRKIDYADTIAARSEKAGSKFVTAIGDNFYNFGVENARDPLFKEVYENVYTHKYFRTHPWYVIAGNHDYRGNVNAQIAYSNHSKTWRFPSRYYKLHKKISDTQSVDLVFIDTTPFVETVAGDSTQLAWLEQTLKKSSATWIIVIGHHQIYSLRYESQNVEENIEYMISNIRPLLIKYKVAAYVNGHHHTLEHHVEPSLHYIGIGNTAQSLPVPFDDVEGPAVTKFLYCTDKQFKKLGEKRCYGFGIVRLIDDKTLTFYFFNRANDRLYSATVTNPRNT